MRDENVREDNFELFWSRFPRRVGKLAAAKAYEKALTMATPQEILDGVERYIANKPGYADWCHPVTFLRQGRWMDQYETVSNLNQIRDWLCPHTPHCRHRAECQIIALRKA